MDIDDVELTTRPVEVDDNRSVTAMDRLILDTEHGSASKYADLFDFDADNLEPPFHPNRYAAAIAFLRTAGVRSK